MRGRLPYSVGDVCHLLGVYTLFYSLNVSQGPSKDCVCFYAPKFNHTPTDVNDLPRDYQILWFVVVGDVDDVATANGVASVISDVFIELGILLLDSREEVAFSAT